MFKKAMSEHIHFDQGLLDQGFCLKGWQEAPCCFRVDAGSFVVGLIDLILLYDDGRICSVVEQNVKLLHKFQQGYDLNLAPNHSLVGIVALESNHLIGGKT